MKSSNSLFMNRSGSNYMYIRGLVVHYSADAYFNLQGQLSTFINQKLYRWRGRYTQLGLPQNSSKNATNLLIRQPFFSYRSVVLPQVFLPSLGEFDHHKWIFRGLNFAKYLDSGVKPLTTWADLSGQAYSSCHVAAILA